MNVLDLRIQIQIVALMADAEKMLYYAEQFLGHAFTAGKLIMHECTPVLTRGRWL